MAEMWLIGLIILGIVIASFVLFGVRQHQKQRVQQPPLGDIGNISNISNIAMDDQDISLPPHLHEPKPNLSDTYTDPDKLIIINVFATENRSFVGYELLQALLSAGFRYGELRIFHRYENLNGKGNILFSVAQSTEPGVFDIQNMGAVYCKGLTLFMYADGSASDLTKFQLMLESAKQLAQDLEGELFDKDRYPLRETQVFQYQQMLQIPEDQFSQMTI